jgi:hypothetical protein
VRTRFERFPASIKGAFVLQGGDGNPHSARFVAAAIARIPSGTKKPVPVEQRMLDVAPARDLFIPFEVSVSELEPAWYVIESALEVDGWRTWEYSSRPFTIPWPRTDVRRGTVEVRRPIAVQGREFVVERIEFGPDTTAVVWRPKEEAVAKRSPHEKEESASADPTQGELAIAADGRVLETLPTAVTRSRPDRLGPGERKATFYPMPRSARRLEVRIKVSGKAESEPLAVPLR